MLRKPCAAVVFDVDGTLVDSERDGHRPAFNSAFAYAGLPFHWSVAEYGRLLAITGGRRRLTAYLRESGLGPASAAALAAQLHADKTTRYRSLIGEGAISPRPGVPELILDLVTAGVRLAVATTGTRESVLPLLDKLFGLSTFAVVVTGSDVAELKPAPDAYLVALARLGVAPADAIAVEDSANGLRAAVDAGLRCVVVTNDYTRDHDFTGAAAVYPSFDKCRAGLSRDAITASARGR